VTPLAGLQRLGDWLSPPFLLSYSAGAGLCVKWGLPPDRQPEGVAVNLSLSIGPTISLIAGILILLIPRLLNYIVAVYLIVIGLVGLFGVEVLRF
jgi:hypothetical protein